MKKYFIILALISLTTRAFAYDFSAVCPSGQTLYYYILSNDNHEVAVTHPYIFSTNPWYGYSKPEGNLVIPEIVEYEGVTYTVIVIDDNAFGECNGITSVVLPNTIKKIRSESFWYCTGISSEVIIPDQCTFIGGYAFMGCSAMSSLTIGVSVDTIQYSAFEDCTGLQAIYCNTPTPPFAEHIPSNQYYDDCSVFNHVPTDIPVYVNCLTFDQFLLNWDWSRFTNMEGVFLGAPELTVAVNNPDYGIAEVVAVPDGCDSQTATVRAIPNLGHIFGYWKRNGAVVSFTPEYTFVLDHDCVMNACFDCSVTVFDSIGYPDHIVGRKINTAGQVTAEYASDFGYDQNGVMNHFSFPDDLRYCDISFFEFPSKPLSISSVLGNGKAASDGNGKLNPPVTTETWHFIYGDDCQIIHSNHFKGNEYYYEINDQVDYYYNNHRLFQKDSKYLDEDAGWILQGRNRYAYQNANKTTIDSAYTGNGNNLRLSTVTINQYDDGHRMLTEQTNTYNALGEITSQTKKTYTYTANNKIDNIVNQVFNDGVWVNSGIAHYVYDLKNRVVEYQTGSWSVENAEWNITKKILYDFNDETQKVTISFRKKSNNEWVWDVFSGQSLFNDSQLFEYQRQLNAYVSYKVNQFEISMHYNTIEQEFPILSKWYYEITDDNGNVFYQYLEYQSDTTINNDKPKVIVRTNQIYDKKGQIEITHEYIMERNSKVFWWNKELQEFTTLYDYLAEPGDEWEIKVGTESVKVHVDSVGVFEHQGDMRKVLHISDANSVFNGDIVVGLGHLTNFFPERLMSKGGYKVGGLRCYWVGEALLYHHGDEDCDAIYINNHGTDDPPTTTFTIYPNPVTTHLFVITNNVIPNNVTTNPILPNPSFLISTPLGQPLLSGTLANQAINVSSLPPGLYFITIGNQTLKFVKQ